MTTARLFATLVLLATVTATLHAEAPKPTAPVSVVMLSDIHFDPFHDPARVPELFAKPASDWAAILATPSPTQAAAFDVLQKTCKMRGIDTPWPLFDSSLKAEHDAQPHPLFVTVSGDLMAHQFDCRFHQLLPKATDADYTAFAAKTVAFVALELHNAFPATPIYLALGNNDSGCKDYAEDPNSPFLKADAATFAATALNAKNSLAIAQEFSQLGDYTITLPAPMQHTRLIVLQNIFESKKFNPCSTDPLDANVTPAGLQIVWLKKQLEAAKAAHQTVWVMAHIPPGIDAYSTLAKGNVCTGDHATMFLASSALGDAIAAYPATVSLALFGHTHMDEMKLLHSATPGTAGSVPVKIVPSITPVNGNNPAFTVATVNPTTATLKDYTVIAASNQTGIDTTWAPEYTYSTTYAEPDFSAASLTKLADSFIADATGTTPLSHAYQTFYFVGDPGVSVNLKAAAMQLVWHGYACSMTNTSEDAFRTCACPAKP